MAANLFVKRIKNWVNTALNKQVFKTGNFIPLDGDDGSFKVPAEFFEPLKNLSIVSNGDYLYAVVDQEGHFLFGIKYDGSVDWQKGIPDVLSAPLNWLLETLPEKVDKVNGKSLVNSVFADGLTLISNDEFLLAVVDENDKELFSIDRRGQVNFQKGVPEALLPYVETLSQKVDKVDGKGLVNSVFADGVSIIPHESYAWAVVDKENRVLMGIDWRGNIDGKLPRPDVRYFNSVQDMKKCQSTDIKFARTLGFYKPGDGGAATYIVELGSEENGLSSFRMYNGKIARLIIENNYLFPEQVGYTNEDRTLDLRTYLFHITRDLKVDSVHLYNKAYYQNGPWIVPRQGISIIGSSNSGNQQSDGNWYFTRILYSSTRTDSGACVFNCEFREFRLENVEIRNLDAEDPSKPPRIGIYTLGFYDDPTQPDYKSVPHYDMIIKNVRLGNFEYGLNLSGNIKWDLQIDNVRCTSCRYGCRIYGHALVATFKLFYPDHCEVGVLIDTLTVAVSFLYCNFGTINKAVVFDKGYEDNPYGQYTFVGCNFELDEVPAEPKEALFLEVSEIYRAMITMIGCNFNMSKIENASDPSVMFGMKLNNRTEMTMIGCQQTDMRWEAQLLNPSYPARKKLGSVQIIHSEGIGRPNYTAEYLPTISIDGSIVTNGIAALNDYYSDALPGIIVYDVSQDKAYIKLNNTFKEV